MDIKTTKGAIHLGRELFWDIPEKNIDLALERSPDWVIVRVFEHGTLDEISEIIRLYGESNVRNSLLRNELKPVAKAMAWLYLDLDL